MLGRSQYIGKNKGTEIKIPGNRKFHQTHAHRALHRPRPARKFFLARRLAM
jgi:hypothetical protein